MNKSYFTENVYNRKIKTIKGLAEICTMHPDWQNDLHQYCEAQSSKEPELLQKLVAYTWRNTVNPRMLSGHLQGSLLSMLSALIKPQCILEIGTFTGYSALCLAEGLPANGKLHSIEADAENAWKAQQWIDQHPRKPDIQLHCGEALTLIPTLNIHPDLVFVDADKQQYQAYFESCFPITAEGGLMVFDNTLWSGRVLNEEDLKSDADTRNMHAFNQYLAATEEADVLMLPIRDGLTLLRKRNP